MALSQDIQARIKWAPGTLVVWDVSNFVPATVCQGPLTHMPQNRVTAHSAILDWDDGQRRHLARITPQAERPYETAV